MSFSGQLHKGSYLQSEENLAASSQNVDSLNSLYSQPPTLPPPPPMDEMNRPPQPEAIYDAPQHLSENPLMDTMGKIPRNKFIFI